MQKLLLTVILIAFSGCEQTSSYEQPPSQSHADACDHPDANINCCFENIPATLTSIMAISKPDETGDKLVITGTVFQSDGKTPYPNIILYAYHTDNTGHYSKKGNESGFQKWHGYLHGWCKTDSNGHYEIHSIRPARYPDNTFPAHIHCAVKESNGKQPFYINDFVFKDDNLVNEEYLSSLTLTGGTGVVDLVKDSNGTWVGSRNITLKK